MVNHLLLEFLDHRHRFITALAVPVEGILPLLNVLYGGVPGVRTSSVLTLFSGPGNSCHIIEIGLSPDDRLSLRVTIPA
jgi:hypothetical protein